jgi:hypothetical protein
MHTGQIAFNRRLLVFVYVFLCSAVHAQDLSAEAAGTAQAVGLFVQSCIRLAGEPATVRDLLRQRHVPELTPEGRAIFLRDRIGVGFDATNKATRMVLISEDNGACSVFAETVDTSKILGSVESVFRSAGASLVQKSTEQQGSLTSHDYDVVLKDRRFKLVISTGDNPKASIHTMLTLAPNQ